MRVETSEPSRREFTAAAILAVGAAVVGTKVSARQALSEQWTRLPTVAYRGKQDDIVFVTPDVGWYGNGEGKLYGTTDGGNSWTRLMDRPGTFVRALGFIDERVGFFGNVGVGSYPKVTDAQPLYRTHDGGRSWLPVTGGGVERMAGVCAIDILPIRRLYEGIARATHLIHAAGRVNGPASIARSEDGGESWSVIDLSAHAAMILDVKFHDERIGFVAAASHGEGDDGGDALILRTVDGGRSWTSVYRSRRRSENVWKMSWPSRKVGYGTVQSYDSNPRNTRRVVVKTTDGGRTWRELLLVDAPGVQQFGIGFADERHGWVGARGQGYATIDGGRTWSTAALGSAVNKIRIARGPGVVRAFAIGSEVHRLDLLP